jgi:hypothetical protein
MRYFVDMDGTLAVYPTDRECWWEEPGVFRTLEPQDKVIKAVKKLINAGHEVYTLSAYHKEVTETVDEKNDWLDQYLPEIDYDHRIFTHVGTEKTEYIPYGLQEDDVLLDDYNPNLVNWAEKGGIGIKLLNGINSAKSWDGVSVHANGSIKNIVEVLTEIDDILEDRALEQQKTKSAKNKNRDWER